MKISEYSCGKALNISLETNFGGKRSALGSANHPKLCRNIKIT
ncbi:hypothetical protein [Anabaena sp. CCY 0017]